MTADEYAAYAADRDEPRFTDWLRERAEPDWTAATEHRFVREVGDDTVDERVFRRYLVQDYAFVGTLADAVGHAAGDAPAVASKRELAGFLGTLTSDEDDYFERSFDALGVPETDRTAPALEPVTEAFVDLLRRAALEGGYAETLAVLVPAEWIYLTWARGVVDGNRDRFYLDEWVELHANQPFASFVDWLRRELDQHGPGLSARRQRRVERHFGRTVALEVAFFEMAYGD